MCPSTGKNSLDGGCGGGGVAGGGEVSGVAVPLPSLASGPDLRAAAAADDEDDKPPPDDPRASTLVQTQTTWVTKE